VAELGPEGEFVSLRRRGIRRLRSQRGVMMEPRHPLPFIMPDPHLLLEVS